MKNPLPEKLEMPDAEVCLFRNAFSDDESGIILKLLQEQICWQQDHLKIYGREIPFPRLTAWYGDPDAVYVYSNIENQPKPWIPVLLAIKARVEALAGTDFNSVLLNYYRSNADSMGWHADSEKGLGPEPVIASVSFGATRSFQFRHKTRTELPTIKMLLENGSLLLMKGPTQHYWKHQVPRSRAVSGPRINLTFRKVLDR